MKRPDSQIDTDELRACVDELVGHDRLLARIAEEIPQVDSTGNHDRHGRGQGTAKIIGSPAPWNEHAAELLLGIHAAARRHERGLTLVLFSRARFRSGSDTDTTACLRALPDLVTAAAEKFPDHQPIQTRHGATVNWRTVRRDLLAWPRQCRLLLDEARWGEEPWTRAPGDLSCPHCARRLILRPGWERDPAPHVWCLRCPATLDDHGQPATLSWPADAWIAVLNTPNPASA